MVEALDFGVVEKNACRQRDGVPSSSTMSRIPCSTPSRCSSSNAARALSISAEMITGINTESYSAESELVLR